MMFGNFVSEKGSIFVRISQQHKKGSVDLHIKLKVGPNSKFANVKSSLQSSSKDFLFDSSQRICVIF